MQRNLHYAGSGAQWSCQTLAAPEVPGLRSYPYFSRLLPVVILHFAYSYLCNLLSFFLNESFLSCYSSSVDTSPGSIPSSFAFRTRRIILPLRVLGSLSTYSISCGTAMGPSVIRTW